MAATASNETLKIETKDNQITLNTARIDKMFEKKISTPCFLFKTNYL